VIALIKQRWQDLAPNERLIGCALSAATVLLLLVTLLWIPGEQARERLAIALPQKHAQLEQMKLQAARISELRNTVKLAQTHAPDLITTVQTSAKLHNMSSKILSIEADQNGGLTLSLNASFAEWVTWLEKLQVEHHIRVERCHIARTDNGGTSIKATLTGPSSNDASLAYE